MPKWDGSTKYAKAQYALAPVPNAGIELPCPRFAPGAVMLDTAILLRLAAMPWPEWELIGSQWERQVDAPTPTRHDDGSAYQSTCERIVTHEWEPIAERYEMTRIGLTSIDRMATVILH